MELQPYILATLTLIGILGTAYVSWRLGRMKIAQEARGIVVGNETQREIEFREDLLALITSQDTKLKHQDDKIDRLNSYIEANNKLVGELKLANLNLSIENQRLQNKIVEIEARATRAEVTAQKLQIEVERLKEQQDAAT